MVLWRISNHADLLGVGGMIASARWHTAGRPIVYLAEHPAAAMLEVLVHLELDESFRPPTYQLLKIEAPEALAFETVPAASLPVQWRREEATTQAIGDAWLERASSALMRVPSAITPETWNWLLNPRHADAVRLQIVGVEKHLYDSRLI